jgi:lipopolysaccharide export LptBFGC system permease protein LptF
MQVFGISIRDLILPALVIGWLLLTLVVFPRLGIRT